MTAEAPAQERRPLSGYPLSPMQRGMWFHAESVPGVGVDTQQIVITLREQLDVEILSEAWQASAARHDVLRTYFEALEEAEPLQYFADRIEIPIAPLDWRGLTQTEREAELQRFLMEDRLRGFDLARPPLTRLTLIRYAEAEYRCVWTFHHIQLDGRSYHRLLWETFEHYDALMAGEEHAFEPARSFREYLSWIHGQPFEESRDYWEHLLAGIDSPTPIPFARKQELPPVATAHANIEVSLSRPATEALVTAADSFGVTVNTLVQGAWALALHHHTSDPDIVFATTRACRNGFPGLEEMVGVFINTLPIRSTPGRSALLREYLAELRQQWLETRPHEHTPLSEVQGFSGVKRGSPLFHSLVVFENHDLDGALRALGGSWSERSCWYRGQTNFPLTLMVYNGSEMTLRLEYDPESFAAGKIQQLLGHVTTLLSEIPECGELSPLDVPYLPEPEARTLLEEWNPDYDTSEVPGAVHAQIAAQAKRTPDAVAVRFGDEWLSYSELEERVESLARVLTKAGASAGELVGVCLERSLHTPVALLAVLHTGAAYVPLDPRYPRDRLDHMLRDSLLELIVTENAVADRLPKHHAKEINLDSLDLEPAEAASSLENTTRPSDRAYVIYTSGSTGKPKGVEVPHAGLSNFLASMSREPGLGADDVLVAVTTVSFDIAALELYLPLCVGAQLVIAADSVAADGRALASLLESAGATALQATPATWNLLLDAGWGGHPGLKMLCGGEALSRDLADRLLETGGELWNMYGPTEATIWSSAARIARDGEAIHIGRPIQNTSFYILDGALRPAPIGAVGELYIGGLGVARGYLKQPELSRERFLANPFRANDRIYRTGDLARYLEDGRVECLGRVDHQVKIRGFRIEPGEIEAALRTYAAIEDAVVVVQPAPSGGQQLVGYVTVSPGAAPSVSELRKFCKTKLPEYMVPATLLTLEKLPLTDNGKVDRKALPKPDGERPDLESVFVPPRSVAEKALARIWREVLLVEEIGVHDDFFDLGGDSLLALKALRQIREQLGMSFAAHVLFERRTVRSLADHVEGRGFSGDTEHTLGREIEWRAERRRAAIASARARSRATGWAPGGRTHR